MQFIGSAAGLDPLPINLKLVFVKDGHTLAVMLVAYSYILLELNMYDLTVPSDNLANKVLFPSYDVTMSSYLDSPVDIRRLYSNCCSPQQSESMLTIELIAEMPLSVAINIAFKS